MVAHVILAAFALQTAEFAKYHREITGRDPAPDAVTFAIDAKVSSSGRDAYAIRSVGSGVRITGSNERSVWYGLYDLLERRGGCHWFWDADVVPHAEAIDLSGLDVREEAHFEYRAIRYFAHRGLTRFQAEQWGPADWRRELDWCLKRRLNVVMLRIGSDDLFQRAFPKTCAYPDPAKDLPGHGAGYDNRTLFWPLEFRGKLRMRVQHYARERGLMVPEDFGTMTHWYSRTPEDFLDKMKPTFLPQATREYAEKNGLVWDIREAKWVDAYWKLSETAVRDFGEGKNQQLLHTIGLGERRCSTNRAENLALKIRTLQTFLSRAHREYPNAKTLIAGWDFYLTWHPDEVSALVRTLDPQRDIIWDYEGDATRDYRPWMQGLGGNNFTKWGVQGKFPYTYSVFLAFENALDIRANYPLIEARQKLVQNDPACVGYIFWPESSHTDTLLLRYFTANAWAKNPIDSGKVLNEFCASRYGDQAEAMNAIWQEVVPISRLLDWGSNCSYVFTRGAFASSQYDDPKEKASERMAREAAVEPAAKRIFAALAQINVSGESIWRDAIDLARTTLDRLIVVEARRLSRDFKSWCAGTRTGDDLASRAATLLRHTEQMADLLELHTDYSLWESYQRLDAVEKVRNPHFPQVLLDNASCGYCQSHQYELARHWYVPRAQAYAQLIAARVTANARQGDLVLPPETASRADLLKRPLESLRPTTNRTPEAFTHLMRSL